MKPVDSSDVRPEIHVRPLAVRLAVAAWVAWLLSLVLPAFTVESRTAPMVGFMVLPMGLLFGWAVFGWAAYANIFWWITQMRLSRGQVSAWPVAIMLALLSTILGFNGVIQDEGSGTALPVVSWGWGALLWGASLILLTLASAVQAGWSARVVGPVLAVIAVAALAIGGWGQKQRSHANLQEREAYFSWGMAFTVARLSGVPLVWPSQPVIPPGGELAFEIDPRLNSHIWFETPTQPSGNTVTASLDGLRKVTKPSSLPYLSLPQPERVRLRGEDWMVRNLGQNTQFLVRVPGEAARYVLRAREEPFGAVLSIVDTGDADRLLYEQQLHLVQQRKRLGYAPALSAAQSGKYGVSAALERALGSDSRRTVPRAQVALSLESATQPCDVVAQSSGEPFMGSWDGRQIILRTQALTNYSGFCSSKYIALVAVRETTGYGVANETVISSVERNVSAIVFDRQTLELVAQFRGGKGCTDHCPTVTRSIVRGLQIDNKGLTVHTTEGNLLAAQRLS